MQLLITVVISSLCIHTKGSSSDRPRPQLPAIKAQRNLIGDILGKYNLNVRPVRQHGRALHIQMSIFLLEIISMNDVAGLLNVKLSVVMTWTDEFLTWEPEKYLNISSIDLPSHGIWQPDITLNNNAYEGLISQQAARYAVHVSHQGHVMRTFPLNAKVICPLDVRHFPWDIQICTLSFSSYNYYSEQVNLSEHQTVVNLEKNHSQWSVLGMTSRSYEMPCGAYESCTAPVLKYYLVLQRQPLGVLVSNVWPVLLISAISVMLFSLTPASGELICSAIQLIATLQFYQIAALDVIPVSGDGIPFLSWFMVVIMCTILLGMFPTTVVIRAYVRSRATTTPPPAWLENFCFKYASTVLCMRGFVKKTIPIERVRCRPHCQRRASSTDALDRILHQLDLMLETEDDAAEQQRARLLWLVVTSVLQRCMLLIFFIITAGGLMLMVILAEPKVRFPQHYEKDLQKEILAMIQSQNYQSHAGFW